MSGRGLPRHFQCKKCRFDGLENETNNSRRVIRSPRRHARAWSSELLAKVPIAASLGRIGPIPAHVDRPRRRHSIGGDDGAQCESVKDGPVVGLLDPWPHRPHDRGGFHSHSAAPAHRNMGPTGCDASMSNCDVPVSDRDASMFGCDATSSDDASMPNVARAKALSAR